MHIPHTYCFSPDTFPYYVELSYLKMNDFGTTSNGYHMYGLFEKSKDVGTLPKPKFEIAIRKYNKFIFKEKIKLLLKKVKLFDFIKKIFIYLKIK